MELRSLVGVFALLCSTSAFAEGAVTRNTTGNTAIKPYTSSKAKPASAAEARKARRAEAANPRAAYASTRSAPSAPAPVYTENVRAAAQAVGAAEQARREGAQIYAPDELAQALEELRSAERTVTLQAARPGFRVGVDPPPAVDHRAAFADFPLVVDGVACLLHPQQPP